jgi:hypothetical protein
VSVTSEAQHPSRLTGVLEERDAPVERLLASVQAAGPNNVFLEIAGLSRRLELLLPVHPAVLEVVAPGIAMPDPAPARGRGLDEYGARIGSSESPRALWKTPYPEGVHGGAMSITTECDASGPTPYFAVLKAETQWDRAIDVVQMVADPTSARAAAVSFGMVAWLPRTR